MKNDNIRNLLLLSAEDIASWQISEFKENISNCHAILPALQRGSVWKVQQIEMLWDSLLRGFPIGSFMLSPYEKDNKRGEQDYLHSYTKPMSPIEPTHHLLDGQQRCNAISLGFFDPWKNNIERAKAVLWIDLSPIEVKDGRFFVFRAVTSSHPWGYRNNDPSKTLEVKNRRRALSAYQSVCSIDSTLNFMPGLLPLNHAWPWDAVAPVPLAFVIEVIRREGDFEWKCIQEILEKRLPYWHHQKMLESLHGDWRAKVLECLDKPSNKMNQIYEGLQFVLGKNKQKVRYQIPGLVLKSVLDEISIQGQSEATTTEDGGINNEIQDPVETLFIRVNSAGTPLKGEELSYSILKSIWPDAQDIVDNLSTGILLPSRLVTLISRLILSQVGEGRIKPPPPPDVNRFRRLVHGRDSQCTDFKERIQEILRSGHAAKLLEQIKKIMTISDSILDHRLPPILLVDLARKSPDVFFLVLVWLDRMIKANIDPLSINPKEQKYLIGTITSVAWFANNQSACVSTLWDRMCKFEARNNLQGVFSKGSLKGCLKLTNQREMQIIPLIPPDGLKKSIEKTLPPRQGNSPKWYDWDWYKSLEGKKPVKDVQEWYDNHVKNFKMHEDDFSLNFWSAFIDRIWNRQELVLYAQREWLVKWFPVQDPLHHDQLEDTDRPWDIDHIHPVKYHYNIKSRIPTIIKDWHGSIGNLRAWPFELNRSDGEIPPRKKLNFDVDEIDKRYYLLEAEDIRRASFVADDWEYWQKATPHGDNLPANYLGKPDKYGHCRFELVKAITTRLVLLYRNWYEAFFVKDLL